MNKPSICYFLPTMNIGGAEKHVIHLASALQQRGYPTRIVTIFQEGPLKDHVLRENIPFTCLHVKSGWNLATVWKIFQWLRANRTDILHTYLFGFHFYAGLPARLLKVPVILSSRREIAQWKKRRHWLVENFGNYFADRIVCCSRAVQSWTLERENVRPEQVLTIYNGVDLNDFNPQSDGLRVRQEFGIPEGAFLVGTVANFSHEKGYPYLLDAISVVLEKNPSVWFLLAGAGPLQPEMKARAAVIPRSRQIIFAGSRSDIPEILSALDVFTLASIIEGFPNVVLEAMAMAKPVVATEVGGIPELIETGEDGILVKPRASGPLAEAILQLLADRGLAGRLGNHAGEKIRRDFMLTKMLDQYEALYLSLWQGENEQALSGKDSSLAETKLTAGRS